MSAAFGLDSLPERIPIFPLTGALVLPRGQLPLNIFEPRYLAMVRDAMAGQRLIGMVQPKDEGGARPSLYPIGGLGRITQFAEADDGRFVIALTGITRFRIVEELEVDTPYRQVIASYSEFAQDWGASDPLPAAVRAGLEESLKTYLDAQGLGADWDAVSNADDESLVNALSGVCPFDPAEKQALLEAPDLRSRADALATLMAFAQPIDETNRTTLH